MNFVVTGGAGFVAIALIGRLLELGGRVTALDNLCRGSQANLASFARHPRFTFVRVDLHDLDQLRAVMARQVANAPVDEVWHLAANSDIPAGVTDPRVDLRDTFMTTFNVLLTMREVACRRIMFASSSAMYGDHGDRPIREDAGPLFPISNYGAMKLASEAQITAAAETFLEKALLFRFPNVVGVPATHGVILDLVRKLKSDSRVLPVLGDGTQRKSYLHVSDLVEAMLLIRERCRTKLAAYNIGPLDDGITVRRIAEEIVAAIAPGARIEFGAGDRGWIGDVPKFRYSVAKLTSLGWAPKLDSLAAVRRAIEEIAVQECIPCARP